MSGSSGKMGSLSGRRRKINYRGGLMEKKQLGG